LLLRAQSTGHTQQNEVPRIGRAGTEGAKERGSEHMTGGAGEKG